MEFSKRFTTDECWPADILAANPAFIDRYITPRKAH